MFIIKEQKSVNLATLKSGTSVRRFHKVSEKASQKLEAICNTCNREGLQP